ncbi:hypothetical protein [uncultured Arcticibacterium sp.]|uniref:YncE family protein n=1 Tax=uncultured Arcticibacterium sp. TaxID=2173042 RepID=UPI0030FC4E1C
MNKLLVFFLLSFLLFACKSKEKEVEPVNLLSDVAFVVSGDSRTVEVIDLVNQQVLTTYSITEEADRFPHHIYLSADKQRLAIANPAYDFSQGHLGLHGKEIPGGIVVLDAHSGEKLHDIAVPFANHNALFSPDDSQIWTTGFSHSGKAYVYNSDNGNALFEVQVDADPSEILFTNDGQNAVVRSGESTFVQFINLEEKAVTKIVKVDLSAGNVWPGYDDIVLVSNSDRNSVNFVNTLTYTVTDFLDFDFSPGFLTYNELTKELWVCNSTDNNLEIFQKEEGTWKQTGVMQFLEADPHMLKFYDGGKKALLVNQKENTAVFIDAVSKESLKTISVGSKPNGIAIL